MMKPIVGLALGRDVFTGKEDVSRLSAPLWGPDAWLRDLELRLALPNEALPRSVRVPRFAQALAKLDGGAFYAASFAADPLGTADALLAWRDGLVEAGWDGSFVEGGGPRLDSVARIESLGLVPPGDADRLARVLSALRRSKERTYERISLVEDETCWPGGWRAIFAALQSSATSVDRHEIRLHGAPATTDLGRVQTLLRGGPPVSPASISGDGTLVVLRGDTELDLAALAATIIGERPDDCLVLRAGAAHLLDKALVAHGLPSQGLATKSAWRPAMQVLPLAIELAFEPRDPHRALELLTLPVGPFRGIVGSRLARALARAPGIGSREWHKRRDEAHELLRSREHARLVAAGSADADAARAAQAFADTRMRRVADWLEGRAHDPCGTPREVLAEIVARVRTWLLTRMDEEPAIYGAAFAQAHALSDALANERREVLSREEIRQVLDTLVRASDDHERAVEAAGRVAHVKHPAAVLASCGTLVWWRCVAAMAERPARVPWNRAELAALARSDVGLVDPRARLAADTSAWRRAILAARERVVLVIPATIDGEPASEHPIFDELVARLGLDRASTARVTFRVGDVLARRGALAAIEELPPLALPDPPPTWRLPAGAVKLGDVTAGAATALDVLVTCPLRWTLEHCAELRAGAVTRVAEGVILAGTIGHRLVEDLFERRAFDVDDEDRFVAVAAAALASLLRSDAATLLLPGAAFERSQLVPQVLRAARELRRWLRMTGYRIAAVEEVVVTESAIGPLSGRLDVRLEHPERGAAVLDLKWGESRYREVLRHGRAIQLAVYARAIAATDGGELPAAGYFALRSGNLLATDARLRPTVPVEGPPLQEIWSKTERTAHAVVRALASGLVPVAAHRDSADLLEVLGVPEAERAGYYEPKRDGACTYCSLHALCGRAWDGVR